MIALFQKYSPKTLCWGLFFCLVVNSSQAQTLNETEKLVSQWLGIERQTAAMQEEWQQQQPVLQQRLELLQAEAQQLQTVLNKNNGSNSQVDQQRANLLAEQTMLEAEQQQTVELLQRLNLQLDAIQGQLPPLLLVSWQQQQADVDDNADTSKKLQLALAKLSKLSEFSNRISVNEAAITSPDGQQILVKQLYLGVSIAWFVSADQSYAGIGKANENGWQWQFKVDLDNSQIAKSIAIYEKQQQAEFVQLPLQLNSAGGTP